MYHCVDSRNFPASKNLQALNLISKTSNNLFRSRYEMNTFNRLPVIKEEGGNPEDDDLDFQPDFLSSLLQNHYRIRKGTNMKNSMNVKHFERIIASKSITRLPPLASINCFMVNNMKEAEQVWEKQFGKCVMDAKNSGDSNLCEPKVRPNETKEEYGDCQPLKVSPSRKSVQEQSGKNVIRGEGELQQSRSTRKSKNIQNLRKKFCHEKLQTEKYFDGSLSVKSLLNKSQQYLPENTQSTPNRHSNENYKKDTPGSSSESFSGTEELSRQKKHETKKETCHLCEKVFYDSQQYAQHLLTHEAVDKFSCKICKIHFLSLRRYKQHCRDFHFTPSNDIKSQNSQNEKKLTQKFECKRCKALFEMEQNFETHKRIHNEKDLFEKYLLSSKNV